MKAIMTNDRSANHMTRNHRVRIGPAMAVIAVLAIVSASMVADAEVVVQAPDRVFVDEGVTLQIVSNEAMPTVTQLPEVDGLQWLSNVTRNQVNNNGRRVFALGIGFRAMSTGEMTIPPITVQLAGREVRTKAVTFTAVERTFGRDRTLNDLLIGEITLGDNGTIPDKIYLGQEVPMEIRLYAWEELRALLHRLPRTEREPCRFCDFSATNRDAPKFSEGFTRPEIRDGLRFTVFVFRTRFSPLTTGTIAGTVTIPIQIVLSDQQTGLSNPPSSPFDDDLLRQFFRSRTRINKTVTVAVPEFQTALFPTCPPAKGRLPAWSVTGSWISRSTKTRCGSAEPLALELTITGTGSIQTLNLPDVQVPGYRVYERKIRRTPSRDERATATVTWVLIPLARAARPPSIAFSVFSPVEGKYRTTRFEQPIDILPALSSGSPTVSQFGNGHDPNSQGTSSAPPPQTTILYLKTSLGSRQTATLAKWYRSVCHHGSFRGSGLHHAGTDCLAALAPGNKCRLSALSPGYAP